MPVPVTDALVRSVPGTGDGHSLDLLHILLLVLLGPHGVSGLAPPVAGGLWLQGSRVPKAPTRVQAIRMVPLSWQGGRAEGLLPSCEPLFLRGSDTFQGVATG